MALRTANSYISLETKHPTEHCSLSCRACGGWGAPCSCLKACSSCRVPHISHCHPLLTYAKRHRQVFNLGLHGSCYSHVCKYMFLFQTYLPTSLSSSSPVLDAPTVCLSTCNAQQASTAQCFSEQPTRAALWQLQCYERTQITYLDPAYLSPGQ